MSHYLKFKFFIFALFFLSLFPIRSFADEGPIVFYHLDDVIHEGTLEILENAFELAKKEDARAIFITLDTPGGLLNTTEEIVKLFLNSEIPIIVHVGPRGSRAGSAGTFITMAAHIASMAPGTYIGAAHPVQAFGGGGEKSENDKIMDQKIESATVSFITAIAKERNRNEEWAKKAVLESESITEDQALEKNVIDYISKDIGHLLEQIDGKKVQVLDQEKTIITNKATSIEFVPNWKLQLLNVLASPSVMYILFLLLVGGAYLEFTNPGLIIPGSVAGVCLILLLIASRSLPVNSLGILLIILALSLFILEIFVTSFGLLTIGGLIAFVCGSLFLFDAEGVHGVSVPVSYIAGATGGMLIITFLVGYSYYKGLKNREESGPEGMIGEIVEVIKPISKNQKGKIFLWGEYWTANSDDDITTQDKAVITEVKNLKVRVKKST
jgi:membrane-bound serine protease (ClpP class)